MDADLPIVTTPMAPLQIISFRTKNALFVEPHDLKGLASVIETLLGDMELRARMAAANREQIRTFDPRVVAGVS